MSRAIASCAAADGFALPYVPSKRDPHRARVEPERVRSDHVAVDASVAALVDRPEAIDEEVVADVVPAVRLARGRAGSRARSRRPVPACSRCDPPCGGRSRTSPSGAYDRRATTDRLVRPPLRARDDRRDDRRGGDPQRHARRRAPDEMGPDGRDVTAGSAPRSGRRRRPTMGCRAASLLDVGARATRRPGRRRPPAPPDATRSNGRRRDRVRNSTVPVPRHETPASVNRGTARSAT